MKTRIYFLDNLRTFLIFLVVLLHAGIVYETILENTWIVSDPEKNSSIGLIRMYLNLFVMFIMFFISGYFIPNSLKGKSTWEYLKSKFNRIMLPWILAVFTLIPIYKVIFLYSRGLPQEEWFTYFHLFERTGGDLGFFADNPVQNWLWFLPVLFLFQVVYLVLSKTKILSIKISLKVGVVLTFVLSLVYSLLISELGWSGWYNSPLLHFQNERLLPYFLVFLLGSLCNKNNIFESGRKNVKFYILSNVVLTISLGAFTAVALNLFFNLVDPSRNFFFVSESFDKVTYYVSMLLSMLSLLHILVYLFRYNLNKNYRIMKELNRNSYAVYIIHVIVIGLIALILLNLSMPAMLKYVLVTLVSYIVSNVLVSAFRKPFQYILSKKAIRIALPVTAVILSIMIFSQAKSSKQSTQLSEQQKPTIQTKVSIHEAAFYDDVNSMKEHIAAGSDLNEKDVYGSTPLIIAAIFGKTEVAIELIDAGADLHIRNNEGSTPLHIASFFCRTEIVMALLEKGADRNLRNKSGSTPIESIQVPFEYVKPVYDNVGASLEPMGLKLDHERIEKTRPLIVEILESDSLE